MLLVSLAVLVGLPGGRAQAQVVQDCQPTQYLDRTATGADRQLTWEFEISTDPERCLQVRAGQTVRWIGDLEFHPLGGQGGDSPNPISLHQDGSVTFNTAGTFGFVCLSHTSMKGAIKVVSQAVPALSPGLAASLTILLLATGLVLARTHRRRRALAPERA